MTLFLLTLIAITTYYFLIYRSDKSFKLGKVNKKNCPNCHNPVEDNFNVCPICKETLIKKCNSCGERVEAAWKFCPYCEKSTTESEEK